MPGATMKIRDMVLMRELESHPEIMERLEQAVRAKMKKMAGVDAVEFDWVLPRRSTAKAVVELDIEYTVKEKGLMPLVTGDAEWTRNASDEMREMLEQDFFPGIVMAVWFLPHFEAGFSQTQT